MFKEMLNIFQRNSRNFKHFKEFLSGDHAQPPFDLQPTSDVPSSCGKKTSGERGTTTKRLQKLPKPVETQQQVASN